MYPSQVSPAHIEAYGQPQVKSFELGGKRLEIVNFPVMPNRARLAKDFGTAGVLTVPAAQQLLDQTVAQRGSIPELTLADWDAIGAVEQLPAFEPLPPEISENMERNRRAVDFRNTSFDQITVDALWTALTRARDTNLTVPQPIPHTLLMGPPGTSKSKVARMVAAVLERPFFQINAEQVSPEIIQAQVMGESVMIGTPWLEAKELVRMGGLREAPARRQYLAVLATKPIAAFTTKDYQGIAEREGLEKGNIYTRPGKAYLAKKYGGELNITEINCLRGDAITLLTGPVLDVYSSDHPNYTVIADANPSSEKHSNRFALPPEIIDRFGNQISMEPLSAQQLTASVLFSFTGQQPTIRINGASCVVTAQKFGITVDEKPGLASLSKLLTPATLQELAKRVSALHYNLEQKITEGKLDRRESERPRVAETTTLTRRGLGLFLQGMAANLDAESQGGTVSAVHAVAAIGQALESYYVRPFSFQAEKIAFLSELDVKKTGAVRAAPDELFNTREVIANMLEVAQLKPAQLESFIETFDTLKRVTEAVKARVTDLVNAQLKGGRNPVALPPPVIKEIDGLLARIAPAERDSMHVALDENRRPFVVLKSNRADLTAANKLASASHFNAGEPQALTKQVVASGAKEFAVLVKSMTSQGFTLPRRADLRQPALRDAYLSSLMTKPACYLVPILAPGTKVVTEEVDGKSVQRMVEDPTKPEEPGLAVFVHHSFAKTGSPRAAAKDEKGHARVYNRAWVSPAQTELPVLSVMTLPEFQFWDPSKQMDVVLLPLLKRELPVVFSKPTTPTPPGMDI